MKNTMSIKIPARSNGRSRAHGVLFDHDSPFRPQTVTRKDLYRRRDKHVKKSESNSAAALD